MAAPAYCTPAHGGHALGETEFFSNLLFRRPSSGKEFDFDESDVLILPPPDLYADEAVE